MPRRRNIPAHAHKEQHVLLRVLKGGVRLIAYVAVDAPAGFLGDGRDTVAPRGFKGRRRESHDQTSERCHAARSQV